MVFVSFSSIFFFFLMIRRPPRSTLFPYTRSSDLVGRHAELLLHALDVELFVRHGVDPQDRKSTRLNSSHVAISYAVFCLIKKIRLGGHLIPAYIPLLAAVPLLTGCVLDLRGTELKLLGAMFQDVSLFFFFFDSTAIDNISPLYLHVALPL